jgi:hypothetical protein
MDEIFGRDSVRYLAGERLVAGLFRNLAISLLYLSAVYSTSNR